MGTSRLVFPLLVVIAAATFASSIPGVDAWNISVNPLNQNTEPGGTVTYIVSILYDRSEGAPFPVEFLVYPSIQGVTVDFSPNNREVPFTSIMTVHVSTSVTPGSYIIHIWAHMAYVRFPAPDDKETTAGLVVSQNLTFSTTTSQTGSALPTVTMEPKTASSTTVEQRSVSADDMWLLSIFGFAVVILLLIAVFRRMSRARRTRRLEAPARYCINCGAPLTATGAFCVSCGAQQNTS